MLARAVLRNLTSSRRLSDLCLSTTLRHTKSAVRRQSFDEPRYVFLFVCFAFAPWKCVSLCNDQNGFSHGRTSTFLDTI